MTVLVTKRKVKMHKHDLYLRPQKKTGFWAKYMLSYYVYASMDTRLTYPDVMGGYGFNSILYSLVRKPIVNNYRKSIHFSEEYITIDKHQKGNSFSLLPEKVKDKIMAESGFITTLDNVYLKRVELATPVTRRFYGEYTRLDTLPDFLHFVAIDRVPIG